jgi:competence protein ComFC
MAFGWLINWSGINLSMRRVFSWFKDLLFPRFCLGCKEEGNWLCKECLPKNIASQHFDLKTGATMSYLDGLTALFRYGENPPSELIRMLKYKYITEVLDDLRKMISVTNFNDNWQNFVVIPVPLHPRRERERGFNQAEKIARLFAEKLQLTVSQRLRRSLYTKQQAILSGDERRKNLNNAFVFTIESGQVPDKVLLVDDVFTTGSTLQECAKALKAGGVQTVWGLVLAKD